MEAIDKIKSWASALADVGVSLIALGIVLEVLFAGQSIPFWPDISVIGNVENTIAGFPAQGLVLSLIPICRSRRSPLCRYPCSSFRYNTPSYFTFRI